MDNSIAVLYQKQLDQILEMALLEDFVDQDVTSDLFLSATDKVQAYIIAKESGVFFGKDIITWIAKRYRLNAECVADGYLFKSGERLITVLGSVNALLKIERTLLNFIQRLSGVATLTRQFIEALNDPAIAICDTRKTNPGMRYLQKAAVLAGGGTNHRFHLADMMLIKENHIDGTSQPLEKLLQAFKLENPNIPIQIEARDLAELESLPLSELDMILLDNFSMQTLEAALNYLESKNYQGLIEVSGNITLTTIKQYRHKKIHRISVGALTHSAPCIDLSLLLNPDLEKL